MLNANIEEWQERFEWGKKATQIEKLTKKFLLPLAEGKFIVSNLSAPLEKPLFKEPAAPLAEREAQWKRIVATQASGKLCHVFNSTANFPPAR